MKRTETIKGKPIVEVYESFDGSYWYVTEKAWKQDSLIGGRIYKSDQIFYGYVRLSHSPQSGAFGYFSQAKLQQLGRKVWKVDRRDWAICPGVEMIEVAGESNPVGTKGCGMCVLQPASGQADEAGHGKRNISNVLDREISLSLLKHGIFLSNKVPPITRPEALVLLAEAKLDRFVKEWQELVRALLSGSDLHDLEATPEEMSRWFGDASSWHLRKGGDKHGVAGTN